MRSFPSTVVYPLMLTGFALSASFVTLATNREDPSQYLVFESVNDGRCQILSAGGKLRVVHNRHTDSAIEFRLMRTFVGKPQGLSTGVALPHDKPVKLGCTRVDGRPQDWTLVRARFAQSGS